MQNQQQQQVNESNNVRSHLRSEVNSELHDFYPDFNSQQQTNVDQCFNPLQRTDLNPCLNSQQMNNFNPSFNQQRSNYCGFNSHANSDPTNSRFGRRQPFHKKKHPTFHRETENGKNHTRNGDKQETERVSHVRRVRNQVRWKTYHEKAPYRHADRSDCSGNRRRSDTNRVTSEAPEPMPRDRESPPTDKGNYDSLLTMVTVKLPKRYGSPKLDGSQV